MATEKNQYSGRQLTVLVLLRMAVGWHFLYEGIAKLLTPGWSAAGYLEISRWIFGSVFQWMASNDTLLSVINFLNIWGLIFIGLGLMLGVLTRMASVAGMTLLLLYYLANPPLVGLDFGLPAEGHTLVVDKNLIEFFALFVLILFPTGHLIGLQCFMTWTRNKKPVPQTDSEDKKQITGVETPDVNRRNLLKSFATLPFAGAFAVSLFRKIKWESWEEQNLVDAVTSASVKTFDFAGLKDLKEKIPLAKIKNVEISRLIMGGNLLSGWAHSRDLIYVSSLVKAYHHKDKIFATLLTAEKCGINTLLTNPIMCTMIAEYWKRRIGRIQFISDCVGLGYTAEGAYDLGYEEGLMKNIKRAIAYGAISCYIQGETTDYYREQGKLDLIARALEYIRSQGLIAGLGAHRIESIKACVDFGMDPDFWMKTLHHHHYWSAGHPTWHDNLYCYNPEETIAYIRTLRQPVIAFKTLAAGAIHPKDGFRFAFENGADFICAGMYDFQMVENVNIALDLLKGDLHRERPWVV